MHREHFESTKAAMDYLKEFIGEYNTQDNRMTASPYFFVIRDSEATNREEEEDDAEAGHDRRTPIVTHQKNVFFTEKAIEQHMKENHHHYSPQAYVYLDAAWRNPELQKILEAVGKVCGVEYKRK